MDEKDILLAVGKNLQAVYSKAMLGEAQMWAKLSKEDQQLWLRIARRAKNKLEQLQGAVDRPERAIAE
jgi:hypothetical protein